MNKEESLALHARGRDAWNVWAGERLDERERLKEAGKWVDGPPGDWNDETRIWHESADVDFRKHEFETVADFSELSFPGDAWFDSATFSGLAWFDSATFSGLAWFDSATFSGNAGFDRATFSGFPRFHGATFSGDAGFDRATFSHDARFDRATFSHDAGFDRVTFSGDARFHGATFSGGAAFSDGAGFRGATFFGDAWFDSATFSGDARFHDATFSRGAGFHGATFSGDAGFHGVTFSSGTWFDNVTFSGDAWFDSATFSGDARFDQSVFGGLTRFDDARFAQAALFYAATGKTGFSLTNAWFGLIPDFVQAHFEEAPRLDNLRIEPGRFRSGRTAHPAEAHEAPASGFRARLMSMRRLQSRQLRSLKNRFAGDSDLAARWRALKRLAVNGHDHQQELTFFKGELQALRWSVHKPWHAPFWFGLFYQWLSDFGRSIMRPLLWWLVALAGFGWAYFDQHRAMAGQSLRGVAWFGQQFRSLAGSTPPIDACIVGGGEPWLEALSLSLRKGLLFLGTGARDRLDQIHACLYGVHTTEALTPGTLPASFTPVIPVGVDLLGLAQMLVSAVLIFLFLLAIRNHFRIK